MFKEFNNDYKLWWKERICKGGGIKMQNRDGTGARSGSRGLRDGSGGGKGRTGGKGIGSKKGGRKGSCK